MRAVLAFAAAANPAAFGAALSGRLDRRTAAAACTAATAVAVLAATVSEGILDFLDVTAATFRVATGVVLGVASVRWLAVGVSRHDIDPADTAGSTRGIVVPLLVPLLVSPQLVAVSVSVGVDDGVAIAALGAAIAMSLAWVAAGFGRRPSPAWSAGARLVAVVGVAVALAIAVDGVKSV